MGEGRATRTERRAEDAAPGVAVCVVAFGAPEYRAAAEQTLASVLHHTDAPALLVTDASAPPPAASARTTHLAVLRAEPAARRFLAKLAAWRACVAACAAPVFVFLDADAVFVRAAASAELAALVADADVAMVEQTRLLRLGWGRADYRSYYAGSTLRALDASAERPPLERFRFFNSGFAVWRRRALEDFLAWCAETSERVDFEAAAARGLPVTDQDFALFWIHQLRPHACATLDWSWNHGADWDTGFPRPGARVIHFSSFYHAPTARVVEVMRRAWTGRWPAPASAQG